MVDESLSTGFASKPFKNVSFAQETRPSVSSIYIHACALLQQVAVKYFSPVDADPLAAAKRFMETLKEDYEAGRVKDVYAARNERLQQMDIEPPKQLPVRMPRAEQDCAGLSFSTHSQDI